MVQQFFPPAQLDPGSVLLPSGNPFVMVYLQPPPSRDHRWLARLNFSRYTACIHRRGHERTIDEVAHQATNRVARALLVSSNYTSGTALDPSCDVNALNRIVAVGHTTIVIADNAAPTIEWEPIECLATIAN